jgi:hypothetical protein
MSMEPALTLREVFAALAGQNGAENPGALAAHQGLPEDLLIRAIGSYADTAPAEVAEHLSAFVAAPTGAEAGLHLLAAVPVETPEGEVDLGSGHDVSGADLDDLGHLGGLGNADSLDSLDHAPVAQPAAAEHPPTSHPAPDADFGHSAPADEPPESHELHDFDEARAEEPDDAGHVSLEDLSHDTLTEHDADPHHVLDPADEPQPEHHGDDGHLDPGLDHFAG